MDTEVKTKSKTIGYIITISTILASTSQYFGFTVKDIFKSDDSKVVSGCIMPKVIGMTEGNALVELKKMGLSVIVKDVYKDGSKIGFINKQFPIEGSFIKNCEMQVTIDVSCDFDKNNSTRMIDSNSFNFQEFFQELLILIGVGLVLYLLFHLIINLIDFI